jgi:hypothetical protein
MFMLRRLYPHIIFVALLAIFVLEPLPSWADQEYEIPAVNGVPVDGCAQFQANCGQASADQFCRTQGFAGASRWNWAYDLRTWVIGSNRYCDRSTDNIRCGGLRSVVCTGQANNTQGGGQTTQAILGRSYPPGKTKTCRFTAGPLAGTVKDFYDIPGATWADIGGYCHDGLGSTGVALDPYGGGQNAQFSIPGRNYPPGKTKTCRFTTGALAGTVIDYYDIPGATWADIGGYCYDGGTQSTGVAVDPYAGN